ncbi:hypothetical protein AMATHDRAFT_52930 [Amanita thiersii Skay4041]|uniref:Uncharacterized protein n=1 Tax=Amanita thiersii Skay4041 TaxID=703135 RepID=A0A2A9NXD3_9AGAR|nr:hypothetical protein AMATHDRAFT_52930 [Amanita thiersii Skay4041]
MTAVDQLEQQLSATTDAAAAEGKEDVQAAKARGESYLEQAKGLASSVLSTAQSYLPVSVGGSANAPDIGPHTKPKSVEERVRHHEVEEPNKAEDAVEKLA